MCEGVFDRKETMSAIWSTEWKAEELVSRLNTLESAYYIEFSPTESFKTKVSMLSARAKALEEEIAKLDPEGDNV